MSSIVLRILRHIIKIRIYNNEEETLYYIQSLIFEYKYLNNCIKENFNKNLKSHNLKCIDNNNSAIHYKNYSYLDYNILKCNWIKEIQNFKYFILMIFKHI